jgi:hypothetical protein
MKHSLIRIVVVILLSVVVLGSVGLVAMLNRTHTRILGQSCGYSMGISVQELRCLAPFVCVYPTGVADVMGTCQIARKTGKSASVPQLGTEANPTAQAVQIQKGKNSTVAEFPQVLSFKAFRMEYPNSWTLETKENVGYMVLYHLVKKDAVIKIYQAASEGMTCVYTDTDVSKLPEQLRTLKPITKYKEIQFKSGVLRRHIQGEEKDGLKRNAMPNSVNNPAVTYSFCGRLDSPGHPDNGMYFSPRVGDISYIFGTVDQSLLSEMDSIIASIHYVND